MIKEDSIRMQIQCIIENDLFFKGLFLLKWWAGQSCSWLTAHLISVWHAAGKIRFWLNVGKKEMSKYLHSSVQCGAVQVCTGESREACTDNATQKMGWDE